MHQRVAACPRSRARPPSCTTPQPNNTILTKRLPLLLPPLPCTTASWRRLHPAWGYKLWTDEDNDALVVEHFQWFLPTYQALPAKIMRVDAVRYMCVSSKGIGGGVVSCGVFFLFLDT